MTRISTAELKDHLPDILHRASTLGERFIVEQDGVNLVVIQSVRSPERPTLHQLPTLLADVPWPDSAFFSDLASIHDEMNVPVEPPQWPS